MQLKKLATLITAGVAVTGVLAACSGSSGSVSTPTSAPADTATTSAPAPATSAPPATDTSAPTSPAAGATATTGTVRVFISGDTNLQDLWNNGLVPAFNKEFPGITVEVTLDLHGEHDQQTLAKLTAATSANSDPGMDLMDGGFTIGAAVDAGVQMDTSTANIPNLANVGSDALTRGRGQGIPYRASSVLLAYNSKFVTDPPKTLDDLLAWIKANPGKFTYNSPSSGGSGGAFVATVLDANCTQAEQDALRKAHDTAAQACWTKGFQVLKDLGPSTYQGGQYPNGNSQSLQLLGDGSIWMAPVWSDQFITAGKNGSLPPEVLATQITNPTFTGSASYLAIPKSSPNIPAAETLANWVLSADGQAIIASQISGFPVVDLSTLPQELQDQFKAAHPDILRAGMFSDNDKDKNNMWDQLVP